MLLGKRSICFKPFGIEISAMKKDKRLYKFLFLLILFHFAPLQKKQANIWLCKM